MLRLVDAGPVLRQHILVFVEHDQLVLETGLRRPRQLGHREGPPAGRLGSNRVRLREAAEGDQGVDAGDGRGHEEGEAVVDEGRDTGDGRSGDEADAEGSAQEAEQAGPLATWRDVGHGCVSDRHARSRDAIDDAAGEEEGQRAGQPGQKGADRCADEGEDEHSLASDPVRDPAPHRREQQLGHRERGEHRADRERAGVEARGVEREQREDDAEADEVDGHGRPYGPEARRQRLTGGARAHDLRQGGRRPRRQVGCPQRRPLPRRQTREEPPGSGSSL